MFRLAATWMLLIWVALSSAGYVVQGQGPANDGEGNGVGDANGGAGGAGVAGNSELVAEERGAGGLGSADVVEVPAETMWLAAQRAYEAGLFDRAETEFKAYAERFPDSDPRQNALGWSVLAGAEARLAKGAHAESIELFRQYQVSWPEDPLAIHAALREANAQLLAGNPTEAAKCLEREDSPFKRAMAAGKESDVLTLGMILLAEARLASGDVQGGLPWAERAVKAATTDEHQWEARRILVRAHEQVGNWEVARAEAEVLRELSRNESLRQRGAEASLLLARMRQRTGDIAGMKELLETVATGESEPWRREALERLAIHDLSTGQLTEARERLEKALSLSGAEGNAGQVNLRHWLARVLLMQYREAVDRPPLSPESAGLLTLALQHLDSAMTNTLSDPVLGGLQLTRGWCLWEESGRGVRPERLEDAEKAFREATVRLPMTLERAVAQLKLGDVTFRRGAADLALNEYMAVVDGYTEVPEVSNRLGEYAWQQVASTAVALTNGVVADRAVGELLKREVLGEASLKSILLVGDSQGTRMDEKRGRELLMSFMERFGESPLRADAQILLATSWLRESNWTNALVELNNWLAAYDKHPSRPRVEFDRAWVQAQMGATDEAVEEFRQLTLRHVDHPLALTAQLWLGDHFFNQGDFQRSEQAFSSVSTNQAWTRGGSSYRARLLAAEAAVRGRRYDNARDYLLNLLNDKGTPQDLLPSAFFALGNLAMRQTASRQDALQEGYNQALDAFRRVTQYTNSPLMPSAWGRMAECHLQLATWNDVHYNLAGELFKRVLDYSGADLPSRAKASVGLGMVAEKRAAATQGSAALTLLDQAIQHHLDVVTGKILRPGEVTDSWWVREAGLEAGRILEQVGRWREAAGVYADLLRSVPEARSVWDARRNRALARADDEGF